MPGIVVALALISLTVQWVGLRSIRACRCSRSPMRSCFCRSRSSASGRRLSQIPPRLEEVGRSLGQNGASVAWRVVVPLAAHGIGAGAAHGVHLRLDRIDGDPAPLADRDANAGDGGLGEHVVGGLCGGRAIRRADALPVVRRHLALRQSAGQGGFRRLGLTMARLSVKRLTKAFGGNAGSAGRRSRRFAPGSLVAVLGASGSGKTTLLRLLCGFERADSGSIEIDGQIVSGAGVHGRRKSVASAMWRRRARSFLTSRCSTTWRLGLPAAGAAQPRPDGGAAGQRRPSRRLRRAALPISSREASSSAWRWRARSPRLRSWCFSTSRSPSLDAALRVETRQAVATALAASGATALLVTHDQSEALAMGSEVAVLRGGVLAQIATPEMLYRQPVDVAMARFVGEAVILPGTVSGRRGDLRARAPAGRASRRRTGPRA